MKKTVTGIKSLMAFLLIGVVMLAMGGCAPGTHVYASPDYYEYGYSPGGHYHYVKPPKHKKYKPKKHKKHHKKHHHHDD